MIGDKFAVLLEDLSKHLSMDLKPDENNTCLLNIRDTIEIALELEPNQEYLVIGAVIGKLPSGKFRLDSLFGALKANAKPYPRLGTFAYSKQLGSLVLFEMLDLDVFTAEDILTFLTPFIKKAIKWKETIDSGVPAPDVEEDYINMKNDTDFFR